jgi:mitochondrial chaperone BCS1
MINFFNQQLQHNPFFLTAFVAGIVSTFVLYFKDILAEFYKWLHRRLIFTCVIYQNDPIFQDFELWFYAHYGEKYRHVEASTNETNDPYAINRNTSYRKRVVFKQSEGLFVIQFAGKHILVKKGMERLEHATDMRSVYFNQYHFYSIRGSKKVKALLETAVKFAGNKAMDNELRIYSNNSYGEWHIASRISAKNIGNVILKAEAKKMLINDMDNFLASEKEYERRHIFYKRGYCLFGQPGNGKTSLALAMASYLNKDIYCLDMNSLNGSGELRNIFVNLNANSVLLIEDIDGYFNLREPVKKDSKISFSTFLNCLDGAFYKEGLITIITTNKKELLDPALIRAGRLDLMFEVEMPGSDEINDYLGIFYGVVSAIKYSGDLSMCDVQEICLANKESYNEAVKVISKRSSLKVVA